MSIRVLVVDDQPMYRLGVSAILNAQADITVVGEAADGLDALARCRALQPDVVLMDVRMPNLNGIEATKQLTQPTGGGAVPKVIMLTTFDIDDYIYDALRAGASGFLLKDSGPEEIAGAVRTVAAGDALLAPSVTRRLIETFVDNAPSRLGSTTVFNDLTEREREVFMLVARGYSNSEIGRELFIAEQTAKTHVSRVMGKLQLRDRVHAVVLGYETGLVRPGTPE
ncbi:response regulator [Actinotalea subterranea]|uniref:response regulator n=1 Tax=Actinotalea subterranea TaxID=2607497 RepID=UPI00165DC6B8|nr:response regulator transcription factor [Actinotalea subterranea]